MSEAQEQKAVFKQLNVRLVVAVVIAFGCFFAAQFYVTATIGASNAEIESIRRERDDLRLENEILSSHIDELRALPSLDELVEAYNLVESDPQVIRLQTNDLALDERL